MQALYSDFKIYRLSLNVGEFNELQRDDPITTHLFDKPFIVRNHNQGFIVSSHCLGQHRQTLHLPKRRIE